MHAEWGEIERRDRRRASMRLGRAGGRIVAVGTTILRLLESAATARRQDRALLRRDGDLHYARLSFQSRRYAADQFPSAALDAVHAGRAFCGLETMHAAYAHAIAAELPLLFLWRCLPAVSRAGAGMTEPIFASRFAPTDGDARTGTITLPRGKIRTPAFMPVGTAATVKAMYPQDGPCARRRYRARQYLSSDAAPGRGAHRRARRPASAS